MPPNIDPQKLEDRLDRVLLGATEIDLTTGIGGLSFANFAEVMEFAKVMALSDLAIPYHLRNNPGACLAVTMKALRGGFDPFDLAEHSYSMVTTKKVKRGREVPGGRPIIEDVYIPVETIAYDSYAVSSVINAHAPIEGRMTFTFEGEGDAMTCTVAAKLRETGKEVSLKSPTLGDRKKAIGTTVDNGKEKIKGSPLWLDKPQQQLGYDTRRDFARLYFPEVMMGWYDHDEFEEARSEMATDITPGRQPSETTSRLAERLQAGKDGTKGRGFDVGNVDRALEHKPGEVVPSSATDPARETVLVGGAVEGEKGRRVRKAVKETPAQESRDHGPSHNEVGDGNGGGQGEAVGEMTQAAASVVTRSESEGGVVTRSESEEDRADAAIASERIAELNEHPERLVTGDELNDRLEELVDEDETPPEETAPQVYARQFIEKIEAHLVGRDAPQTLDDLRQYKTDMRGLIDKLEGLTPDEVDVLRGRFTTTILTAERGLAKKKGGKR